jgi:Asp-tRNA(Asn)/Glu-tRNA(Gln) amidotransferase A subunit family amidase
MKHANSSRFSAARRLPRRSAEGLSQWQIGRDRGAVPGSVPAPSAAFAIGEKGRGDPVEMYLNDVFTVTVNMAGLPGLSVPAGLDARCLPLGLQLVGRPLDEENLFALGAAIEQAAGPIACDKWW